MNERDASVEPLISILSIFQWITAITLENKGDIITGRNVLEHDLICNKFIPI